jgi:hypothetical protein
MMKCDGPSLMKVVINSDRITGHNILTQGKMKLTNRLIKLSHSEQVVVEVIIATIEALQAKRSDQKILEVGSKKLLINYLKLLILNQVKM